MKTIFLLSGEHPDLAREEVLALAGTELGESLSKVFERDVFSACTTNETEECADKPVITCDNTDSAVIFMKAEGETGILLDDNCITVQGEGFELLRAVDKLLYISYNIIPTPKVPGNLTIET